MTDVTLHVAATFPPGTGVKAYDRVSDFLYGTPQSNVRASARVKGDGTVVLKGLLSHGQYWLIGEVEESVPAPGGAKLEKHTRSLNFTAVDESDLPAPSDRSTGPEALAQAERELAAQDKQVSRSVSIDQSPAPGESVAHRIVTGARGTSTHPASPDNQEPKVLEPQPHPKQEAIPDGQPQRSATPAGQGTPVVPGEPQPRPSQADVKRGTPQRSDTAFGEATPKDPAELQPGAPQESSGKLLQRSDTPGGVQAPKPTTRSPVRQERAREASVSKAKGSGATAAAGTAKRPKGKASTARKGAAAKAAAPVKSRASRAKNAKRES